MLPSFLSQKAASKPCPNGMHHTSDAEAKDNGLEVAVFALG